MVQWIKRGLAVAAAIVVIGGLIYALRPLPVPVDLAEVGTGPLEVTVDEEGVTRIREVYLVSAPVAGKVLRSPREAGDDVVADKTEVAVIRPVDPPFLDARSRRELTAAVAAAEAAVALAEAQLARSRSELEFVQGDLRRAERLRESNTISEQALEKARLDVETGKAAVASETATLELKKRELESARAKLVGPETTYIDPRDPASCCIRVMAPISGKVLKIIHESEQPVQAGQPLLEIGDPNDLEIVVELLSSDAVRISQGARVRIENWGGPLVLNGRVKRVEPAGFKKVSALGIEEQRVNTIVELLDPPETWRQLGHDYRVFVRIVTWSADAVLRVPVSALFREGDDWAVFTATDGLAKLTRLSIGHRNARFAEIRNGLEAGDAVILHPSDRVADGVRVTRR